VALRGAAVQGEKPRSGYKDKDDRKVFRAAAKRRSGQKYWPRRTKRPRDDIPTTGKIYQSFFEEDSAKNRHLPGKSKLVVHILVNDELSCWWSITSPGVDPFPP
jgi:hypothetical protein